MRDWLIHMLGGYTQADLINPSVDGPMTISGQYIRLQYAQIVGPLVVSKEAQNVEFIDCYFQTSQTSDELKEDMGVS